MALGSWSLFFVPWAPCFNYHLSVIIYHLSFAGIAAFGFSSIIFGFAVVVVFKGTELVCSTVVDFDSAVRSVEIFSFTLAGIEAVLSVCIFLASCNSFSMFFFSCIESTLLILVFDPITCPVYCTSTILYLSKLVLLNTCW